VIYLPWVVSSENEYFQRNSIRKEAGISQICCYDQLTRSNFAGQFTEIRDEFMKTVENPLQKHVYLPYPKRICSKSKPFGRYDALFGRVLSRFSFLQIL
jgi:hypothetical protein